jgi:3'-phosphoadenosine 5'-phosphosulfate (PAPS) 3'-phosphatase
MNQIISGLNAKSVERVAGSGNKFVHLTENKSDYYFNFVPGFKNWDMCGSEAILNARFGVVTNAKKEPIEYSPEAFTLKDGIIAAKNKNVFDLCEKRI